MEGEYEVQLAAMRVEAYALEVERKAVRRAGDLAVWPGIEVRKTTLDGAKLYRVVVRPVADGDAAKELCEALSARGVDCFVRRVTSEEVAELDRLRP